MNLNDNGSFFALVIGRQYGSGGRRLAAELARRLGAAYYDRELLDEAARRMGYDMHVFTEADERRPSPFKAMWLHGFGAAGAPGAGMLTGEALFEAQSNVLREIAGRGSCVIVGRASDYVLRHHPRLVSIFLHAPLQHRAEAVIRRGECADAEKAAELALRNDKRREEFYNYFTGRHWGHADNYDLSLDASRLSPEGLADIVERYLAQRGISRP